MHTFAHLRASPRISARISAHLRASPRISAHLRSSPLISQLTEGSVIINATVVTPSVSVGTRAFEMLSHMDAAALSAALGVTVVSYELP